MEIKKRGPFRVGMSASALSMISPSRWVPARHYGEGGALETLVRVPEEQGQEDRALAHPPEREPRRQRLRGEPCPPPNPLPRPCRPDRRPSVCLSVCLSVFQRSHTSLRGPGPGQQHCSASSEHPLPSSCLHLKPSPDLFIIFYIHLLIFFSFGSLNYPFV